MGVSLVSVGEGGENYALFLCLLLGLFSGVQFLFGISREFTSEEGALIRQLLLLVKVGPRLFITCKCVHYILIPLTSSASLGSHTRSGRQRLCLRGARRAIRGGLRGGGHYLAVVAVQDGGQIYAERRKDRRRQGNGVCVSVKGIRREMVWTLQMGMHGRWGCARCAEVNL